MFRFYTDKTDSVNACTKWAALTINEMENVYNSIDLRNILDKEYDSRKCRIERLHMRQLRTECQKYNLLIPPGSKKVCSKINLKKYSL